MTKQRKNRGEMTNLKKGQKGFTRLPADKVKRERVVFYLTKPQRSKLKQYAKDKDLTPSDVIRERLKDIIQD